MFSSERPDRLEIAAIASQLMQFALEKDGRPLFEQRRLLEQALDLIRHLREGQPEDPFFDGDQSALANVKNAYWSLPELANHEIRAAMLIAAELIGILEPSVKSPLDELIREQFGKP